MRTGINHGVPYLCLGVACVLGTVIRTEAANIPAYTLGTVSSNPTGSNFTSAIQFDIVTAIDVTAIGVYVRGADGTSIAGGDPAGRKVTLWEVIPGVPVVGGNPLITTIISDGTPGSFLDSAGDFRYVNLSSPLTLNPGIYRLGSFIQSVSGTGIPAGDNATFTAANVTFDPKITPNPVPNAFQSAGDVFPTTLVTAGYRISANLLFDDGTGGGGGTTVPEPSLMLGMIVIGLGGLLPKMLSRKSRLLSGAEKVESKNDEQ